MARKNFEALKLLRVFLREAMQPMFPSRISFEDLSDEQDKLDKLVVTGKIKVSEYIKRWEAILSASGWTQEQYDLERDRRWDYIDSERELLAKRRYTN